MRKFRFIGDPDTYNWDEKPILGNVYPENHFGTKNGIPNEPLNSIKGGEPEAWISEPNDWQEVTEPETKPLHKDTDLGYFAGLAMQSCIREWSSDHRERLIKESILLAKELIKQLDNE